MTCDQYNDLDNLGLLCRPCHRRALRTRGEELPRCLPVIAPSKASAIRLGEEILRRREEQRLTRKQLATRAHISAAYLARIEQGGASPAVTCLPVLPAFSAVRPLKCGRWGPTGDHHREVIRSRREKGADDLRESACVVSPRRRE